MLNAKPIVEATRSHLGLGVNAGAITPPVYVPAEKLTEAAACDWIANALVGQSIQYHEGFLMMDRSDSGSGLSAKERSRLHSVARRMWIACELGLVHLFSLKVPESFKPNKGYSMAELPSITCPTRDAIFAAYEADAGDGFRAHLGASLIGKDCERALWFDFRWVTRAQHPGRLLRLFETGQLEEARLVQNLRRTGATVLEVEAFPIEVEGFELNGNGQVPRPRLRVANVTGTITALVLTYQDLVGAKITRKRTLAKYLDAVNFEGGVNSTADPSAEFADDVYYVDRKSRETRDVVEFELAASFDLEGVSLPRRQIVQNVCPWRYRGSECGYTGTVYLDTNDQLVGSSSLDVCGKRLSSCKARFGQNAELPFGGFPAAGLIR